MAVVGASGSGKSSLVGAGLVPAFRRRARGFRGGDDARLGSGGGARSGRVGASSAVAPRRRPARGGVHALSGRGEPRRFFDALMDLCEAGSTSVVVTLRGGLLRPVRRAPSPRRGAGRAPALLGPMRTDELRRAIEGPARAAGLRLEAGLVDAMLADVEGEPGALPLLSHALYESWARRDGRVLTRAGYRAAGGVRGAIAHTAEEVFLGCSPQEQALMRRMLLQLTELGETTEDTRRRVPLAELIPEGEPVESGRGARAVGGLAAPRRGRRLGRDRPRGADPRVAAAARMVGGGSGGAPSAPPADGCGSLVGRGGPGRGRPLPRAAAGGGGRAGGRASGSSRASRREFLRGEPGGPGPRARERAAPGQASARPARGRRGGAGGGVDRRGLRAGPTGSARRTADRRTVRTTRRAVAGGRGAASGPGAPPRAGGGPARRLGRHARCAPGRARARIADPRVAQGVRRARQRDGVQPGRQAPGRRDRRGDHLWDTATWRPVGPPLRSSQGGWSGVDFSPDGRTLAIAGGKGNVELWDVDEPT